MLEIPILLGARPTRAIKPSVAVESELVVALGVVDGGAVSGAAVSKTGPGVAADVAEGDATDASMCCVSQEEFYLFIISFSLAVVRGDMGGKQMGEGMLPDVIACFGQFDGCATGEAALISFFEDYLLEIFVYIV